MKQNRNFISSYQVEYNSFKMYLLVYILDMKSDIFLVLCTCYGDTQYTDEKNEKNKNMLL